MSRYLYNSTIDLQIQYYNKIKELVYKKIKTAMFKTVNTDFKPDPRLLAIREKLLAGEDNSLSSYASPSRKARRRAGEERLGHRPDFAVDTDRILHSRAYTRYIDKTQVFYMIKNDHITHRVLHVQLVSRIARTIGRVFNLNEDLIEAIALGHDIGHPPFGHDGERILSELCLEYGLLPFQHNIQSVRFLENIEQQGRGWNLTVQTLDGILCHDGEIHNRVLHPSGNCSFAEFDDKLQKKEDNPKEVLIPLTMEGCVVRFADTISYIGRDIEDAIELDLITRNDIPLNCRKILGKSNGTIVHNLVADLLLNNIDNGILAFSPDISAALLELKQFNYDRIYLNPLIKKDVKKIENCYQILFASYLENLKLELDDTVIYSDFLSKMDDSYRQHNRDAEIVRDYISGMTDNYFLGLAKLLGCEVP